MNPTRQERFEAIFAAHYGDVHRYALRRAEPPLAEEIVNETFLVAWRRFDDVPDEPLPWLYATAGHVLANRRREATRHARRDAAPPPPSRPPTARDPAERLAERDAALRAFAAALRARPRGPAPRRLGAPQPRRRRARPPACPAPPSRCASAAPAAASPPACASRTPTSTSPLALELPHA